MSAAFLFYRDNSIWDIAQGSWGKNLKTPVQYAKIYMQSVRQIWLDKFLGGNNMKKTALSLVLSLVLVFSLMLTACGNTNPTGGTEPTTTDPTTTEPSSSDQGGTVTPAGHAHCICGGTASGKGDHVCAEVSDWIDLNANLSDYLAPDGTNYRLPTGNYYLSADLALETEKSEAINPVEEAVISICLNGYKLTYTNKNGYSSKIFCATNYGATLNIADCKGTGSVQNDSKTGTTGRIVYGSSDSKTFTLNLFGGTFKDEMGAKNAGGLFRIGDSVPKTNVVFNMYGGTIDGGYTAGNGGNIAIYGKMDIYGGVITNGSVEAGKLGPNIYVTGAADVTIHGGAVTNGTAGETALDIYVNSGKLTIKGLDADMKVYVKNSATFELGTGLTKEGNDTTFTVKKP